jgi:hypothetical protein
MTTVSRAGPDHRVPDSHANVEIGCSTHSSTAAPDVGYVTDFNC